MEKKDARDRQLKFNTPAGHNDKNAPSDIVWNIWDSIIFLQMSFNILQPIVQLLPVFHEPAK